MKYKVTFEVTGIASTIVCADSEDEAEAEAREQMEDGLNWKTQK